MTEDINYYRLMLGAQSVHFAECFEGGFIGVDVEIEQDLTGEFPDDWREFNPNDAAMKMASKATDADVQQVIEDIARRAELVGPDGKKLADLVRAELKEKLDYWQHEAQNTEAGRILCYNRRSDKEGVRVSLLSRPGMERWEPFTCLNSLREVEPTSQLMLDERPLDFADKPPDDESAEAPEEEGE